MLYDDTPLLIPSNEIVSEDDEPIHEDLLSYYGNLYDNWLENNSASTIDFSELDPIYDNLDDGLTMAHVSLVNEKVFACNDDNHSKVESAIGSTNVLQK